MPSPAPALFAFAHPDDETLAASVAIAEHLAAGQRVHVAWLTQGMASGTRAIVNGAGVASWWGVQHDPTAEGYDLLTPAALGAARVAEGTAAVRCLAAGLPGTLTVHAVDLPDGGVTQASAYAALRELAGEIGDGGPVRIKTHSHLVDDHADHRAIGAAARQLGADYPDLYADRRHYILPPYWTDSRLAQVTESWDLPTDAGITARVRAAIRAYGAWQPAAGAFAIGWHSVPDMFTRLNAAPRCLQHT